MLHRSTAGGCPLCGANHATCGQPSASQPVDILKERAVGNYVQKYRVTVNGHETTMKLSAEDVENYPDAVLLDDVEAKPAAKSRRAPNKARTAQNKAE